MAKDNPPNFALLLGKRLDKKDAGEAPPEDLEMGPEPEPGDNDEAMKDSALGAFFDALQANDKQAGIDALKDYFAMCEYGSAEEPSGLMGPRY